MYFFDKRHQSGWHFPFTLSFCLKLVEIPGEGEMNMREKRGESQRRRLSELTLFPITLRFPVIYLRHHKPGEVQGAVSHGPPGCT